MTSADSNVAPVCVARVMSTLKPAGGKAVQWSGQEAIVPRPGRALMGSHPTVGFAATIADLPQMSIP